MNFELEFIVDQRNEESIITLKIRNIFFEMSSTSSSKILSDESLKRLTCHSQNQTKDCIKDLIDLSNKFTVGTRYAENRN